MTAGDEIDGDDSWCTRWNPNIDLEAEFSLSDRRTSASGSTLNHQEAARAALQDNAPSHLIGETLGEAQT